MLAPYVNSYRRLIRDSARAGQHHVGLRQPHRRPARAALRRRRRGGSRTACPSSDANPYLAIAASLACGYLGMIEGLPATEPTDGSANDDEIELPRGLLEAVALFEDCEELVEIFGKALRRRPTAPSSRPSSRPSCR